VQVDVQVGRRAKTLDQRDGAAVAFVGLEPCTATIRVRLLKIGAAVLRNTRRVRLMLASQHPLRELFAIAVSRLTAAP
jgi:hypothetical protein